MNKLNIVPAFLVREGRILRDEEITRYHRTHMTASYHCPRCGKELSNEKIPCICGGIELCCGKGPRKIEYNFYSCNGCIYLKSTPNTEGSVFCINPYLRGPVFCINPKSPLANAIIGKDIDTEIFVNHIKTPDWCPILLNMGRQE